MAEVHFTALGGANEVGASCYLLNAGNYNILLDGGIRVNKKGAEALPYLEGLPEQLDLVLFSHAHMDHLGAFPAIYETHPESLYFTTCATKKIGEILLRDCIKIMTYEMEKNETQSVLYSEELLEQSLWKLETKPLNTWFEPLSGIKVYFHPAGHIVGAVNIIIYDTIQNIKILYTGDISIANQKTVSGTNKNEVLEKPDLLIMESTYGSGNHPKRQDEEARLAMTVGEIINNGGIVLIPAFALGRAQEIILIIRDYILGRKIPSFPIYVDGLVRTICDTYTDLLDYLPEKIKNYVKNAQQPIFWNESPSSLAKIIKGNKESRIVSILYPCCIISSSGMLGGGPSVWYAKQLLDNKKNAILITGYQDEESPGRKLMELETGSKLKFGEEEYEVKCRVERYHLSAHADQGQLCQWVSQIKPGAIILIHGDPPSIQTLRSKLTDKYTVWAPQNKEKIIPLSKPVWMTEKFKTVLDSKDVRYNGRINITDNGLVISIDKSILEDPLWKHYYSGYSEMELKWHGTRLMLKGKHQEGEVP